MQFFDYFKGKEIDACRIRTLRSQSWKSYNRVVYPIHHFAIQSGQRARQRQRNGKFSKQEGPLGI